MRIFVDFDYTLCNTVLLKEDVVTVAREHGVELVDLPESRETYNLIGHYTLRKHLERSQCPEEKIAAIEKDFFTRAPQWLYPDAVDFFQHSTKHQISVLSYGDVNFQQRKIEASGIAQLAHEVICTPDTKADALKKVLPANAEFMLIDDRAKHLNEVCEAFPNAKAVRIMRKESPYLAEITTCAVSLVDDLLFQVDQVK
ncbi:MAG: hypothetical protein KIH62_001065 [Candidatus Kerfeldbacteria bacterium]|nr:hypothetical protein [Candidatus Kerfeldbacteria bacterium]